VLLIAASILAARKLAQYEGGKRVPATMSAIADAVRWAGEIMKEIDNRHNFLWKLSSDEAQLDHCNMADQFRNFGFP
jgi:hypothetical protein